MTFNSDDMDALALCAWKEARGEGFDGMRAVMHVILHRALQWYGAGEESVHSAIYAKNQFTSMSVPSDPEFNLVAPDKDSNFAYCVGLAPLVLANGDVDITNGALYYANLKAVTSGWFIDYIVKDSTQHPQCAVIGHHTFFK